MARTTMTREPMDTFFAMQDAMNDLRAATGDRTLASGMGPDGRFRLERVTHNAKGRSTVEPLTDWREPDEHLADLRARASR